MPKKPSGRRRPSEKAKAGMQSPKAPPRNVKKSKQAQPLKAANRGQSEKAAMNRERAFVLRAQRKTYREIASELGVSVRAAFQYVEAYWAELNEATREKAEMVRQMELDTLDQMQARWEPLALHPSLDVSTEKQGADGQPFHIEMADYDAGLKAVDRVLKIQDRRAKLLGLDAAQKVEGTVKHTHMTLEEMEQRMRDAEA